jgi:hypothetical protein
MTTSTTRRFSFTVVVGPELELDIPAAGDADPTCSSTVLLLLALKPIGSLPLILTSAPTAGDGDGEVDVLSDEEALPRADPTEAMGRLVTSPFALDRVDRVLGLGPDMRSQPFGSRECPGLRGVELSQCFVASTMF